MKRKGPIITLAAGLAVAAVLMVLNVIATRARSGDEATPTAADAAATTAASTAAAPTTAPPAVEAPGTYVGEVGGGGASLAIAVKDGQAIAYLCDGRNAEAWLQGTAKAGQLNLTGSGASLTGTYANGVATGTVTAAGKDWTFSLSKAEPPSGLYRAAANVASAQIVGGWIILADGTQVGTQKQGTTVSPAPKLNLSDRTSVLGGVAVTATAIDGTKL